MCIMDKYIQSTEMAIVTYIFKLDNSVGKKGKEILNRPLTNKDIQTVKK